MRINMQSQFQNVQDIVYSLRKGTIQQRQKKFIIDLRIMYVYTNGLGDFKREFLVFEIPIPVQELKKINFADYIFNYLLESHGIGFKKDLEISFVVEGKGMTIAQTIKKNSTIVKEWLRKNVQPTIVLMVKDLIYLNRISQAVVVDCDSKARIKQRLPTRRSGNYQIMLHEVTIRLNKHVTAKTLSIDTVPVGTGLNVIITAISENGRIDTAQIYSPQIDEDRMFHTVSVGEAQEMSLDKRYKDVPVGKILPANVLHFKKVVDSEYASSSSIQAPSRRLDFQTNTFIFPLYYEYILELCDSKIELKGSSLCDPMLDKVLKAVHQQSHHRIRVNVKIKSISSIREFQMHPEIKINFQIESLNDD